MHSYRDVAPVLLLLEEKPPTFGLSLRLFPCITRNPSYISHPLPASPVCGHRLPPSLAVTFLASVQCTTRFHATLVYFPRFRGGRGGARGASGKRCAGSAVTRQARGVKNHSAVYARTDARTEYMDISRRSHRRADEYTHGNTHRVETTAVPTPRGRAMQSVLYDN